MKKKMTGIMLLAALFSAVSVQAADNLQFRGNLVIPNCTVNNNMPFVVDWGDVEIQTFQVADEGYHKKEVSIPLHCPYFLKTPKLMMTGSKGKASNYIQTSKYNEGLIISAWHKTGKVNLGEEIDATGSISGSGVDKELYLLFALGREKNMEDLTPGEFTAGANLQVRYE
ncbi:fimbrial protein [Escherichia marmotae]|uniref:fimbrial protein n=1 Tax=Escherichia TaxID=561 RepID=UPI0017544488|nr:fimbrial protein [Escherichia marmotae]MEC9865829.1 fimbrial protein [Escherichia coli]MEC9625863.1 fimbrial protein [Escherichia marmotae]MED0222923.1 fimbrial protein [Escherichia coli]MED0364653.1 fimbrial protein [Escherichia marmotae]MED8777761.1 fimbrial protein [Escherichia marmotae]